MGEKFWLASYPPGIPDEVDVEAFASLNEVLSQSCERFAPLPAFSNLGATLTYADLNRLSGAFAAFLQKGLGLNKGARVAIMLPNVLQYPVALFGALRAGLTVVNVNPLYTARELEHQLVDSGAQTIVVLENFARTLQQALPRTAVKTVITTELGDLLSMMKRLVVNLMVKRVKKLVPDWSIRGAIDFRACLERGSGMNLDEVRIEPDDIAFLQYTGGTTGVAKGAMLTHRNMVANLQQATAWMSRDLKEGEETVVTPLPLYHIFSLTANCLTFMKYGGHNVLITNPRDLAGFVRELKKLRFSAITGVNTLYNSLLNTSGFADLDFGRLKIALGGGAAVQRAVAERWKAITGRPLIEAYGLTECAPAACINPLSIDAYTGSVGLPIPSTEVSIRDAERKAVQLRYGGRDLRARAAGDERLLEPARGDCRSAYRGRLAAHRRPRHHGRARLCAHHRSQEGHDPGLGLQCVPDRDRGSGGDASRRARVRRHRNSRRKSGEAVKLFVVRRDPNLSAEELLRHFRENVTGYKVPKEVEFRSGLPKSPIGKILRRELRDAAR